MSNLIFYTFQFRNCIDSPANIKVVACSIQVDGIAFCYCTLASFKLTRTILLDVVLGSLVVCILKFTSATEIFV